MVLRIGQRVPNFTLPDTEKEERSLSEFTDKGNTVLSFFPFAFSGVCDKEMCVLRDSLAELQGLNAQVVGVSVDSLFTLNVFRETYSLGFPLLSDFNKKVCRAFDVLQNEWVGFGYKGVAKRSIFVLDKRSMLRYRWITDVPGEEPPYGDVLEALRKLGLESPFIEGGGQDYRNMSQEVKDIKPVIEITENAAQELKTYLQKQGKQDGGLRVFVSAGGCSGLSYGMVPEDRATEDDYVIVQYGAKLIVDKSSMPFIAGSLIDFQSDKLMGGGFVVKNPNAISTCGCGESFKTA